MAAVTASATSANPRINFLKRRFASLINKSQKIITNQKDDNVHLSIWKKGCEQSTCERQRVSGEDVVAKKNDFFFDLNALAAAPPNRVSKRPTIDVKKDLGKTLIGKSEQSSCKKRVSCSSEDVVSNAAPKRLKIDEKAEAESMQKEEIQRMREAARKEIEEMRNDSGICDPQEIMREFAKLIGYDCVMGRRTKWPKESVQGSSLVDIRNDDALRELEEGEILE